MTAKEKTKVYILWLPIDWVSGDIISIHSTLELAEKQANYHYRHHDEKCVIRVFHLDTCSYEQEVIPKLTLLKQRFERELDEVR